MKLMMLKTQTIPKDAEIIVLSDIPMGSIEISAEWKDSEGKTDYALNAINLNFHACMPACSTKFDAENETDLEKKIKDHLKECEPCKAWIMTGIRPSV